MLGILLVVFIHNYTINIGLLGAVTGAQVWIGVPRIGDKGIVIALGVELKASLVFS